MKWLTFVVVSMTRSVVAFAIEGDVLCCAQVDRVETVCGREALDPCDIADANGC